MAAPIVASLLRILVKLFRGKELAAALKNISTQTRKAARGKATSSGERTVKQRTDDAVKIAETFLDYLKISLNTNVYGNAPKSKFSLFAQQKSITRTSNKPLVFTGALYRRNTKADKAIRNYVEIVRLSGGAVRVGFRLRAMYKEQTTRFGARRGKNISVSKLLSILENGARIPITGKKGMKVLQWFFITMRAMEESKQNELSLTPTTMNPKAWRENVKKGTPFNKGKKKHLYWVIKGRPFWDKAVRGFKRRMAGRKNIEIDSSTKYQLIIRVKV